MMATINVRIDDAIKMTADEVLKNLDVSQTQAITAFYQYIAENKKLPFTALMSFKTQDDLLKKFNDILSEALAIALNLQVWINKSDIIDGKKIQQYYRRLDNYYRSAKDQLDFLESRAKAAQVLNALNKILTIIVDFNNFGYGYAQVKISYPEKKEFESSVCDFEKRLKDSLENKAEVAG
ncbi:type II toxin-antitoxin system RelB/DinJ family antitoxin [Lelliottia sp. SL45]|uniref:type II toxin-antitoxin system RelB/DinJ family antitoxin n=1 Tax=Enterobacteriaceae TaxID=543 RepID=UPI00203D5AA4|nr:MULTISPECIES: type II toxin-antitoxin system RelB/DinJ family antitoxin [Enterobacteriaceae]MCM2941213.1 type II toxin-antitoxin system RelB/DinJ family antitoxin [Escherichia coli]MCY1701190.1 type II toxin-antitoxin system RelB/DinJ family antitoxin [Lelliottia sp. SL45]